MSASIFAPFASIFHDFVSDLKTSRRFQICVLLWLPLIVTTGVAVVRLGLKNTDAKLFPTWKTDFIPESSGISYPDVTISFVNPQVPGNPSVYFPGGGIQCYQRGSLAVNQVCPGNANTQQCVTAKLSSFQASKAEVGQNHVTCNISIVVNTAGANQELAITMSQGYVWFPNPPTYVTPNQNTEVDLFREVFVPIGQKPVSEWSTLRNYESSVFNNNPPPAPAAFIASIRFRIPFRAVIVHRQYVDFDDWQLLAAWGGWFTFMAFLHCIVFFVAKQYTAADSKILARGSAGGPGYEPIS